jgi:hypothetical protein
MQYVRTTENGVHIYACPVHGEWHLGPVWCLHPTRQTRDRRTAFYLTFGLGPRLRGLSTALSFSARTLASKPAFDTVSILSTSEVKA